MAMTNAIIKAGGKALTKGSEKAATKATTKAATKATENAVNKAITRGLTGAGMSSLAPKAGSTLDGILGRSSGLALPEPEITPVTLGQRTKDVLGKELNTIGSVMDDMDYSLAEIKADKALSKKNYDIVANNAREIADINNSALDAVGATSKSDLPILNRDQFYRDTLGTVKGNDYVSYKDVPEYMKNHLSNPKNANEAFTRGDNEEILRDLFQDDTSSLSDLYSRYEELAQSGNANEIFTPENIDTGVEMAGNKGDAITQDFADRVFGNKRDISISGGSSPSKNIKVSRAKATSGAEDAVAGTATTTNPALADEVAELKAQVSSAGGGMRGGGTPTATASPDYGGLGDSGFKVKLKNGDTTNVQVRPSATGSTRQQRAIRKLDDMTAKSMNANAKQYRGLVDRSGSIDGHYKTVAERMRAEKIDQANVADKARSALNGREDIKQQGLQYAEANGVTMDLSSVDNLVGLSPTQKRKLSELGLSLDEMLGGKKVVSPTQAEEIYKVLRQYGYDWEDSKDALTTMAGKAMKKEADAIREVIDNTMDNINVDYKTPLVEFMAENGEDPAYIRKIAGKADFKFSDLRKDQSDWITMDSLSGNKIKEGPTINVFGTDTGMPNPLTSGAERLKEKFYERQAYGAGGAGGAGSNGGGGSVPPTGGNGAENTINFTDAGDRAGTLGNLLSKAKSAGLVGAGVLGGLMLGGGGSGGSSGSLADMGYSSMGDVQAEETPDPYANMTIGGYTYDELEAGYMAALQAGDSDAAKLIQSMMGMLDEKVERYSKSQESSNSGVASKQRAALNVLSGLMGNYQAQGPIGGRFTQLMNALTGGGYNPAVSAYDSGASGSLGTIIKALGDTGALSEGDQKRALELLPKTTDSEEAAKYKYQQLIQILQGAGVQ